MFSRTENHILTLLTILTFGWLAYDIGSLRFSDIMLIIVSVLFIKTIIGFFTEKSY